MRWTWLVVLGLLGCGGGDYAGALVTAAAGVGATAIYREATDGCWGNCGTGEECDEASGLCVAAPCRASCRADHRCVWVDGDETCVSPRRAAADELTPVPRTATQTTKKTNHALCLVAGLLDCPPAESQVSMRGEMAERSMPRGANDPAFGPVGTAAPIAAPTPSSEAEPPSSEAEPEVDIVAGL